MRNSTMAFRRRVLLGIVFALAACADGTEPRATLEPATPASPTATASLETTPGPTSVPDATSRPPPSAEEPWELGPHLCDDEGGGCEAGYQVDGRFYVQTCFGVDAASIGDEVVAAGSAEGRSLAARRIGAEDPYDVLAVDLPAALCGRNPDEPAAWTLLIQPNLAAADLDRVTCDAGLGRRAARVAPCWDVERDLGRWIVFDFDGPVSETGIRLAEGQPSLTGIDIVRDSAGLTYLKFVEGWATWSPATTAATAAEGIDQHAALARVPDGTIEIVTRYVEGTTDPAATTHPETGVETAWSATAEEIRAGNGLIARVVPAELRRSSEGGAVLELLAPARLELLDATFEPARLLASGDFSRALPPIARLDDFNGRLLIVSARNHEPALGSASHLVLDVLDGSCLEAFSFRWGAVALVGPDVEQRAVTASLPEEITAEC